MDCYKCQHLDISNYQGEAPRKFWCSSAQFYINTDAIYCDDFIAHSIDRAQDSCNSCKFYQPPVTREILPDVDRITGEEYKPIIQKIAKATCRRRPPMNRGWPELNEDDEIPLWCGEHKDKD